MLLSQSDFLRVIDFAPLVSIDLIVQVEQSRFLLGKRINPPAKDYWFVPGGRIRKNESFSDAFSRITESELGFAIDITKAKFLGPYEHFYQDSIFSDNVSTHYVALAYHLDIQQLAQGTHHSLPFEQHSEYIKLTKDEIKKNKLVHCYSRAYFDAF